MEHALVIGYVEALSGLLVGFQGNDLVITSAELEKLHDLLLEVVFKGLSGKKREAPRGILIVSIYTQTLYYYFKFGLLAALTAALTHSSILSQGFMANYTKWFDCLKFYALHKNPEDNRVGTKMFSKFVGEISHKLTSNPPDSSSDKAAIVEVKEIF